MILAIIPARGGSKRIPRKNIRPFAGRPIIHYSIEAAQRSNCFDKIIVSTESDEIARIAEQAGAEVPFMRPSSLSDDFTGTFPVLEHAIHWFGRGEMEVDYFCCIYATAPFLQPGDIKDGFRLLLKSRVSSVFAVTTFPFPIFRALRVNDSGHIQMFWPEYEDARSNDLPTAYHDAGQFYWLNTRRFLDEKKIYSHDAMPIILPRYLAQDIDTLEDWRTAERMFKALQAAE